MTLPAFLPPGYGYTVAAVVSTFFLTFWQTWKVEKARFAAKIEYPQMYAEKSEAEASKEAMIFNCCQRAHQNTLEFLPQIYVGTLLLGLEYPILAASLCGFWTVSRIPFTLGYSTGDAKKRVSALSVAGNTVGLLGIVVLGSPFIVYKWLKP